MVRFSRRYLILAIAGFVLASICARISTGSRRNPSFAPTVGYGIREVKLDHTDRLLEGTDVIFVHGLGSNPDTSWRASIKDGRESPATEHSNAGRARHVNWVTDFLAEDMAKDVRDRTRLYFYDYNSYWKRDAVATRLARISRELRLDVQNQIATPAESQERGIVFVAHSYGGLVVKKALIDAYIADEQFLRRVKWIIFLGCPHFGSKAASIGKVIGSLLSWLQLRPNLAILQGLEYDSLELYDLHDSFSEAAGKFNIKSTNFFETLPERFWSVQTTLCVVEQSATFQGQHEKIGLDTDHSGLNKFSVKNRNYERVRDALLRALNRSHSEAFSKGEQVYSLPFTTVSTYTERISLSEELEEKLGKPFPGSGLEHAATVTGLGGAGKTQLVLRYISMHEKEYDSILWIDARSEETARSSFERCCHALSLPLDASTGQHRLRDAPAVQAVLQWLRSQAPEKKWLVIVDDADDLTWDVSCIIPRGQTGSVIVTSQDDRASQLLGRKSEMVKVEVMSDPEAVCLLLNAVDKKLEDASEDLRAVAQQIVGELDRLPLAVDLAGARIRSDVEDGEDVLVAMRRYLADFQRHQDGLLQNRDFVRATPYNKTVWTVWETSLASLRDLEMDQPGIYPVRLLTFLTLLDRANIQDELFRLASLGMPKSGPRLSTSIPSWLQQVLARGENNDWDDFHYRETIKPLLRFGLVRRVQGLWKGVTMHGLVRWRAGKDRDEAAYWGYYTVFIAAACSRKFEEKDNVHFRRHMIAHLPSNEKLLTRAEGSREEDVGWTWMTVGRIWDAEGRWQESERLFSAAVEIRSQTLGQQHRGTLQGMFYLARTYQNQERWEEAEELQEKVMEVGSKTLGEEHRDALLSMSNLAWTYSNQGRWEEAEELQVKVIGAESKVLGEEHPDTLVTMSNLALTYSNQGRWEEAEELQEKVIEVQSKVLGKEHPHTLISMNNLARTYRSQERWEEVEELQVKVMEAMSRELGEEHPDTLKIQGSLAIMYQDLGRWEEAAALEGKVRQAESRRFSSNAS